jgi:hypothetical protein
MSMGVDNVNPVELEPFERMQHPFNNMLSGKRTNFVDARTAFAKEQSRAYDHILPLLPKFLDGFS